MVLRKWERNIMRLEFALDKMPM
ncbi:hypothetical protein Goklo_013433 [Gossypium klotzschianum]|uniref:Uncharacterized protein n=1 Tax=Gossypium klotzschianum TaxID=34286 RepID=A0A7J8U4H9_9ROSI|nr:hypothetical protein [Gossypium klotzschianum]